MNTHDVIIVGAGHAALTVASALNERGIRPTILAPDRHVGETWTQRYDALHLNTDRTSSTIPNHPTPKNMAKWPTGNEWGQYLADVANSLDFERITTTAQAVTPEGAAWRVTTPEGSHVTPHVVVATGRANVPFTPDWRGRNSSGINLIHSAQFKRPSDFAGQRILVVGGGNSGTEIAHLLTEHAAAVTLSVRTKPLFVERETFGISITQLGRMAKYLPERVIESSGRWFQRIRHGDLEPLGLGPPDLTLVDVSSISGPTVDSGFIADVRNGLIAVVDTVDHFEPGHVVLRSGEHLDVDTVIAATGYRTGLEQLVPAQFLDDNGWPLADQPPFRAAHGLYFAGFGPATLTAFMPDFAQQLPLLAADLAERS